MSVEFIGSLPESLTQGLLIGKLLIGGLGVLSENGLSSVGFPLFWHALPEFRRNFTRIHRNFSRSSLEFHQKFTRISNRSTLEKGITTTQPSRTRQPREGGRIGLESPCVSSLYPSNVTGRSPKGIHKARVS